MKKKRVVVIADFHCGHRVGLTPSKFATQTLGNKFYRTQVELWAEYVKLADRIKAEQKPDVLIVNGDCIDGRGERSGGTELITSSRHAQVEMAVECINIWEARHIVLTRGTPYHTGTNDDYEDFIREGVKADKIGDHEWINVNGVIFDVKHKVGNTTIPHGKATPIAKERLWNYIWAEHEEQPKSDIIIRSHVHYAFYCGEPGSWLAMTTPALQGQGSKFGARQCSGTIHWGLVYFDIYENGEYFWKPIIYRAESQKVVPLKF
ncbi:MAG: hypothetical protein GY841_15990 [FCB group bacterium]|nr:hypothetical protein [FCB group bacterium]